MMISSIQKETLLTKLKNQLEAVNRSISEEKLILVEYGSKYYEVALVSITTQEVKHSFVLNLFAKRDRGLVKGFIALIKNTRAKRLAQ